MSTVKVQNIQHPSATSQAITLAADGSVGVQANMGMKNKIINGNFDIWQRGTSVTGVTSGQFVTDRFKTLIFGSTADVSRQSFALGQTDVPNEPTYYHRTVVTSVAGSANYCQLQQRIESVRTLAGQTATVSFWAKADASKNIAVEFIQNFGSGGSPSSSVTAIEVTTCALTASWQKFTVTVSIPSISGKTIGTNNDSFFGLVFYFDAGSDYNSRSNSLGQQSGTFDIAQVQLEAGSVATPFEIRPPGVELALCQRYYQTAAFNAYAVNSLYSSYNPDYYYPTTLLCTMRASPTITRTGVTDSGVTGGITNVTKNGFSVIMELTAAAGQSVFTWNASAEL